MEDKKMVKKAAMAVGVSAALISAILSFFPKKEGKAKTQKPLVVE